LIEVENQLDIPHACGEETSVRKRPLFPTALSTGEDQPVLVEEWEGWASASTLFHKFTLSTTTGIYLLRNKG
jgi:hypothetical protein